MAEAVDGKRGFSLRKIPSAVWGLLALALGLTLGTFYPDQFGFIGLGMKQAFRFLASAAPFIIFFTIAAAVLDMAGHGKAGRLAFWVTLTFTSLGILGGLVAIFGLIPLYQLPLGFEGKSPSALFTTLKGQVGLLLHSSTAFIAVIYAAVVAILLHFGTKWKGTEWFCRPTKGIIKKVGIDGIQLVGRGLKVAFPYILFGLGIFIPTAVGDAVAQTGEATGATGAGGLTTPLGESAIALYVVSTGVQVLLLAVYISMVIAFTLWYTKFPVKRFFTEYFGYTYTFAWATASSAASIPVTLERTRNGLNVRKEIADFVVPLGATMNLDGAMVACFSITALASMIVGYTPTILDLILLLIPFKIATMGVPGIPGGIATVVPPIAAGILPLPPGSEATFLAIWFAFAVGLSDQFRTGINTVTNGIVARIFETAYPRHFMKDAIPTEAPPAAPVPAEDVRAEERVVE